MKCEIEIKDIRIAGTLKIVVVRCVGEEVDTVLEFMVDRKLNEIEIIKRIKDDLPSRLKKSIIGKKFRVDV